MRTDSIGVEGRTLGFVWLGGLRGTELDGELLHDDEGAIRAKTLIVSKVAVMNLSLFMVMVTGWRVGDE